MASQIDENLYNRQLYVLGENAMNDIIKSSVLIIGMGGVGSEIAKNVCLMGVKHLTLQDDKAAIISDLGTNCLLTLSDVENSINRAEASRLHLQVINPNVSITAIVHSASELTLGLLNQYQCVILTEIPLNLALSIDDYCYNQSSPVKVIVADVFGIFGWIFCNFSSNFVLRNSCDTIKFQPLKLQLRNPSICQVNNEVSNNNHLAMLAIHKFREQCSRFPEINSLQDAKMVLTLAQEMNEQLINPVTLLNKTLIQQASFTAAGQLPALSTFIGGLAAQETIKAITGLYFPLNQWFHLNAIKLCDSLPLDFPTENYTKMDRYFSIRACIGESLLTKLHAAHIFFVGCSAIGCEILKNCALMGVSTQGGMITLTDHDLIEKSNLSRQFLFRERNINQSKSSIAAEFLMRINPNLNVVAQQIKACSETEHVITESFLAEQNLIVNALDNTEARLYMDRRCIAAQKPMLDSGAIACEGHIQVILPNCTEPYSASSDPIDDDYPYCTIKSFPSQIEHCAQWANEKFHSLFELKPSRCLQFWNENPVREEVIDKLNCGENVAGIYNVTRDLKNKPNTIEECVRIARFKFEKYFNHKAKNLLHLFPEETIIQEGKEPIMFWHPPRKVPKPIEFDEQNELHVLFITSAAQLLASVWNVQCSSTDLSNIPTILKTIEVPPFNAKQKMVVTDESVIAPDPMQIDSESEDLVQIATDLTSFFAKDGRKCVYLPLNYNKDVKLHLDFVYASTNLRSEMYSMQLTSLSMVKKITGRIMPSIASTMSVMAGLATIELLMVLKDVTDTSLFQNWFVNLGSNHFVMSEPAKAQITFLGPKIQLTVWDRWTFQGNPKMLLSDLIEMVKQKCNLNVSMVLQGSRIIWMPILPGHNARLKRSLSQVMDVNANPSYVDLSMTFEVDEENDVVGPPIRLYFITQN